MFDKACAARLWINIVRGSAMRWNRRGPVGGVWTPNRCEQTCTVLRRRCLMKAVIAEVARVHRFVKADGGAH